MADELQAQPVEFGDQRGRDIDRLLLWLAGTVLGQCQAGGHLVVDQHVDLRKVFEQRRRVAVVEQQAGTGHHLVGAHAEAHAVGRLGALQVEGVEAAQLLEGEVVSGRIRGYGSAFLSQLGRRLGAQAEQGRAGQNGKAKTATDVGPA
ncbi:hypothetical protein D3C78_1495290 [compost metagenome]